MCFILPLSISFPFIIVHLPHRSHSPMWRGSALEASPQLAISRASSKLVAEVKSLAKPRKVPRTGTLGELHCAGSRWRAHNSSQRCSWERKKKVTSKTPNTARVLPNTVPPPQAVPPTRTKSPHCAEFTRRTETPVPRHPTEREGTLEATESIPREGAHPETQRLQEEPFIVPTPPGFATPLGGRGRYYKGIATNGARTREVVCRTSSSENNEADVFYSQRTNMWVDKND